MTVTAIHAWLLSRAPYVDWDVYDTGDHIVISAPEPDGIRRIVAVTYAEVAALKP
jgi:hypothetical protein